MNAANYAFHALQGVVVSTYDARLADQWRHAHSTLDEALRCIRQYRRVVEERDTRLSTGALVHSPKYVAYAEGIIAFYVKRYRKALRVVSECEVEMDGISMRRTRAARIALAAMSSSFATSITVRRSPPDTRTA